MEWMNATIKEIAAALRRGEVTAAELAREALDKAKQSKTNSFITVTEDIAMNDAKAAQAMIDKGGAPTLAGIPMALKDAISTRGVQTTCASNMLNGYIPPYDAHIVEKLREQGAVLVGKLNMDEFAMGSTTETSAFGACLNPWDESRSPGGSSGGAAACVAEGIVAYSIGSDTGGSIRQPASYCGVTGLKPTYGAVSRRGLIAYGSSLDQMGPIARNTVDASVVASCIYGVDALDGTSVNCAMNEVAPLDSLKGKSIALPNEAFASGVDLAVKEAVIEAARKLEELGATVEYVSFPLYEYAVAAYYIIACAEAASNLSRFDGLRYGKGIDTSGMNLMEAIYKARSEGFGQEVKRRIMLGNFVLSAGYYDAYYMKALKAKALIAKAFDDVFARFDAVITPTAPTVAPLIGSSLGDPLAMYLSDIYTVPINLAGLCAVSVPCGFNNGLPIGMQLIGKAFDDMGTLELAATYQSVTEHHKQSPQKSQIKSQINRVAK